VDTGRRKGAALYKIYTAFISILLYNLQNKIAPFSSPGTLFHTGYFGVFFLGDTNSPLPYPDSFTGFNMIRAFVIVR
jgi:hypothetical protein